MIRFENLTTNLHRQGYFLSIQFSKSFATSYRLFILRVAVGISCVKVVISNCGYLVKLFFLKISLISRNSFAGDRCEVPHLSNTSYSSKGGSVDTPGFPKLQVVLFPWPIFLVTTQVSSHLYGFLRHCACSPPDGRSAARSLKAAKLSQALSS